MPQQRETIGLHPYEFLFCLYAHLVMARKACFENFHKKKASGKLIAGNVGKGYDCLYDLVYDFEQTITFSIITSLTV